MLPPAINYLLDKAAAGERLEFAEGLQLYAEADLLALGVAANTARQMHVPGRTVTYLIDRNINYTNVCATNCSFCGFYRLPGHPEAYVRSTEDIVQRVQELVDIGGTRILMQGGHHPHLPFDWYLELLSSIRSHFPSMQIDAFSPSEIDHFAQLYGMSHRDVLQELIAVGLTGLPGGGGEILDDAVRQRVSPKKIQTDTWLAVMRIAHSLGLTTTATMVIGLGETLEQRMRHLQRVRDVQDASIHAYNNGFVAFVSWPVQHSSLTSLGRSRHREHYGATAHEYLRHVAMARLFLNNVRHHQASWVTQGPKVGQVSLAFGIDDYGSTMLEENVVSAAAHDTYQSMQEGDIHMLIRNAGYIPAQRDSRYTILRTFASPQESPAPTPIQHKPRPTSVSPTVITAQQQP